MRRLLPALLALPLTVAEADRPIVLKAARMVDGRSSHVASPGLIVVEGGKIKAAGEGAAIPPGAEIVDLGDATLMPGFMDAHTHLSGPYYSDYRQGEMD